jgi:hypothetical protein
MLLQKRTPARDLYVSRGNPTMARGRVEPECPDAA